MKKTTFRIKKTPVDLISMRNITVLSNTGETTEYTGFFDKCVRNKCIVHADVSFLMNKAFLCEFYPALIKYNATHTDKCILKIKTIKYRR